MSEKADLVGVRVKVRVRVRVRARIRVRVHLGEIGPCLEEYEDGEDGDHAQHLADADTPARGQEEEVYEGLG